MIGTHFMNPAHSRRTVEVIRGPGTSPRTLQVTLALLRAIDRQAIVVNDAPGFVSNRVLLAMINDAIRVVEARTAPADDVDRIFVECFGHAMGPLATADLIGLDTILLSLESLHERSTRRAIGRVRCCANLLRAVVADARAAAASSNTNLWKSCTPIPNPSCGSPSEPSSSSIRDS